MKSGSHEEISYGSNSFKKLVKMSEGRNRYSRSLAIDFLDGII